MRLGLRALYCVRVVHTGMVQKRGIGGGNSEEGKRPKSNESDEDDSQSPAVNDDELMRSLEVSNLASIDYRARRTYEYE